MTKWFMITIILINNIKVDDVGNCIDNYMTALIVLMLMILINDITAITTTAIMTQRYDKEQYVDIQAADMFIVIMLSVINCMKYAATEHWKIFLPVCDNHLFPVQPGHHCPINRRVNCSMCKPCFYRNKIRVTASYVTFKYSVAMLVWVEVHMVSPSLSYFTSISFITLHLLFRNAKNSE